MICLCVEIASGSPEEDGISLPCIVDICGILDGFEIQESEDTVAEYAAIAVVESIKMTQGSSTISVVSLPVPLLLLGTSMTFCVNLCVDFSFCCNICRS